MLTCATKYRSRMAAFPQAPLCRRYSRTWAVGSIPASPCYPCSASQHPFRLYCPGCSAAGDERRRDFFARASRSRRARPNPTLYAKQTVALGFHALWEERGRELGVDCIAQLRSGAVTHVLPL